jgi:hypothetical protein
MLKFSLASVVHRDTVAKNSFLISALLLSLRCGVSATCAKSEAFGSAVTNSKGVNPVDGCGLKLYEYVAIAANSSQSRWCSDT